MREPPRTRKRPTDSGAGDAPEGVPYGHNLVELVGRVAAPPVPVTLPSGDRLVSWRLVVDRRGATQPPYVDTIDCAAWAARARRSAASWEEGDVVSVRGELRRRFWRGADGARSRYQVDVTSARRLTRVDR